ncbi:uncharacterized protein LOC122349333 [Puntigrus tetrazona]|uniref:uncharacterized protein LOC122349333 n=1 Tax=Puntigrus tetrazona TaxID=1606681 RepID=UPI001C8A7EDF|nr:uncharacterized protein LOC122349333 [Puntigrus tetrazona]
MCVELSLTTGHAASLQMSREDCETKREVNTVSYRAEGRRLFDMWIFFVFLAHISSDSGTYACGVDRFLKDTYSYIILSVIEVSTLTPVRTSSTRPPPRRTTTDKTDLLVHVGASFGALVLVFTVILFIFIKLKHKQKKRSSGWTPSTHQPDFPTYAALNITAQTDSLNYSSVQFVKGPDCGVKIGELFEMIPVETLYSHVQTRHRSDTTDPNPVIYSNFNKGQ